MGPLLRGIKSLRQVPGGSPVLRTVKPSFQGYHTALCIEYSQEAKKSVSFIRLHMGVAETPVCVLTWYPDLVSFTHQLGKNETLIFETGI
jgi:hypothetical protein